MRHWASNAAVFVVGLVCGVAMAQTPLELSERGVALQIPAGWEVAPADVLASMNRLLAERAPDSNLSFVSGLVPTNRGENPLAYVLIQFLPLKTGAMSREELAKAFSVEYASATMKDVASRQEDLVKDHTTELSFFDASRDRYVMATNMTVPGVEGTQRNYSVGQVLSDGVLQVNCYAPKADFAKYQDAFDALVGSIHVANERRYAPGVVVGNVPPPPPSTKRRNSAGGAIVVVIVVAMAAARRRKGRAGCGGGSGCS